MCAGVPLDGGATPGPYVAPHVSRMHFVAPSAV